MTNIADRPKKGLLPSDALKRWSDPAAFAAAAEFADAAYDFAGEQGMKRHLEYRKRRSALEEALLEQLRSGALMASGIAEFDDTRAIISPALWELLEIDYEQEDLIGHGRRFEKPEFFEPSSIPLNVLQIPEWITALPASELGGSPTTPPIYAIPILFAVDGLSIAFHAGVTLAADHAALIKALLPNYQEGISRAVSADDFEFIRTHRLAATLDVTEITLRRRIGRARKQIADAFLQKFGLALPMDAVIENGGGRGYRLNPSSFKCARSSYVIGCDRLGRTELPKFRSGSTSSPVTFFL